MSIRIRIEKMVMTMLVPISYGLVQRHCESSIVSSCIVQFCIQANTSFRSEAKKIYFEIFAIEQFLRLITSKRCACRNMNSEARNMRVRGKRRQSIPNIFIKSLFN